MKRAARIGILVVAAAASLVLLARWANGLTNGPERTMEERVKKLPPCPDKPNCVCSSDVDAQHAIEPFPLTDPAHPLQAISEAIRKTGGKIVQQETHYLRAEYRTPLLGFLDDVEFLADVENGVLHVRSASRVGYSDLGANRARVERLRKELAAAVR